MPESQPVDADPKYRRTTWNYWIALGLLVVAHAVLGAFLNPAGFAFCPVSRLVMPALAGFFFSQPLLLAFWTAFAPQRFYHRLFWGLLLCALVAFAAEVGTLLHQRADHTVVVAVGYFLSMDLVLFFVATAFLFFARRLSRWKLVRSAAEASPSPYGASQFGIIHLFVLITITAVICGLSRTLAGFDPRYSLQPIAEVAKLVLQITVMLLPTAIVPWITLGNRKHLVPSILSAILLFGISDAAYNFLLGLGRIPVRIQIEELLLAQLGAGLCVVITTLVLRWCGFRMIREAKRQTGASGNLISPPLAIREIAHGSPEYWDTVDLRDSVLREPLGLQYSAEELEGEEDSHHFACYSGNRLVACLVLRPLEGGDIQMQQVAVVPKLQRRRIGRALVEFSEAWASIAGYRRMILHARETAVAFYEKAGYSRLGDRFEEVTIPHWAMEKRLT